ncbi:MAG TPA: ABC transporter substrate-binding protein [Chitinivibrionales bacterium]|nr:ABC transporter substrate-binding protein [Chitinivibrionales bacterium]
MKHLIAAILCALLFIVSLQCSKSKQPVGQLEAVDYAAIQKKAEAFVPAIGKTGGEIILSSFSDPKSFNPITSIETTTSEFTGYLYEGLIHINTVTLRPEPGLAQSWDVSKDGLTWVFHLRPGVVWSDNAPFTAADVEFTFNSLVLNDSVNPNSSRDMFVIDGKKPVVKALDSMTVQFTLPTPFAPFLRAMAQEILPKHKYQKYLKNGSGNFSNSLGIQTPPDSMVSTGPFLVESFISQQKITYRRNPLYWRKDSAGNRLPYLSRIAYMIVLDQNAELLRFKRGEIDYLHANGEDFPGLKRDEARGNYTVYRLGPSSGSYFVFFNQNTGRDPKTGKLYVDSVKLSWFRNVKFRKAVAYAFDKESMIRIVMNGLGYPQWGPMSPSEGYFYNPDVATYPYDLAKAKATLAEAGFTDKNNDSIVEDPSGHPVDFSFVTNSGNPVRQKLSEIIRKDFERLGFRVHFQLIEFNSLIQRIDNPPYEWDAIMLGLTGGVEPHMGKNVWHTTGSLHMWFPRQKTPSTPWEARIDSIFDAAVKELDESKRKALYDEWQRIAADQLPLIYTALPEQIFCLANKFGNINPCPNGGVLHNIEWIYRLPVK